MISYLSGTIYEKEKQALTVIVGGIGYKVFVPNKLLDESKIECTLELHIHLQIREDAWELYGFSSRIDLDFFKLLLSVNGVGPKSALHIFNIGTTEEISRAIAEGDIAFLTKISGIGRKTAERMIVDLKNKVGVLSVVGGMPAGSAAADVMDALVQMGYSLADARAAVQKVGVQKDAGVLLKKTLAILKT
ncbi:MAG: Holliday junction branch migration protein RuvA [Candidatus Magasanikbacteria bacterium]|nr:Holliday junction branch migration protein RuvA [Candidatus Magasanikbacteria bacterium]